MKQKYSLLLLITLLMFYSCNLKHEKETIKNKGVLTLDSIRGLKDVPTITESHFDMSQSRIISNAVVLSSFTNDTATVIFTEKLNSINSKGINKNYTGCIIIIRIPCIDGKLKLGDFKNGKPNLDIILHKVFGNDSNPNMVMSKITQITVSKNNNDIYEITFTILSDKNSRTSNIDLLDENIIITKGVYKGYLKFINN